MGDWRWHAYRAALAWLTWQTRWVHIVYISAAGEELRQDIALSA